MANFIGPLPRLRSNLVSSIIGVLLTSTGCGSAAITNSITANAVPAPAFTSTPGTAATQDSPYSYQIAVEPSTGVTFALAAGAAGATLTGNVLTWTPSAAQSRTANQFSVTATNGGGTVTQSWNVTPAGTINGTWINRFWIPTGPTPIPVNLAQSQGPFALLAPQALVPKPDGSFQTLPGSGNSDGTFSIPNVPGGYYFLQVEGTFYWTSSSNFDLGADENGKQASGLANDSNIRIVFDFNGLDPVQTQDAIMFIPDWSFDPFVFGAPSPVGAITWSQGQGIAGNIDYSQIDMGFMLQYEPETLGALSALALGPEATLSNLDIIDGSSNTVSGTLTHSPEFSFDLNVQGAAWKPVFDNIAPTPATQLGSDFAVTIQPFVNGNNALSAFGLNVPLVEHLQPDLVTSETAGCQPSGPIAPGSTSPLPVQPPMLADQDFGPVRYGDPFAAAWPRIFTFCQTAAVDVPMPGSPTPISFHLTDGENTAIPTSQIAPLVGPVQNPKINGSSLYVPGTVSATGVTLSWTAPSGPNPTGYAVTGYVPTTFPSGVLTYLPSGGTFYTTKTSIALPPLQAAQTYVFLIRSIVDGAANFESSPNRSALPTAFASVISAPMTVNTSQ